MEDIVSLLTTCVTACAEPRPKPQRARNGAYGGPLISRDVPVARSTIQRVLKYATDKERFIYQGSWASLIGLRATDLGIVASISSEIHERQVTASLTIGYANDQERKLFSGEWTRCYAGRLLTAEAKIYPTKLLPVVNATSFGAVVNLSAGIRRRRWLLGRLVFGEWQTFEIKGFRITPEYGEVLTDSDALDYITPRFNWSNE